MSKWYHKVTSDLAEIANCILYYENEIIDARAELNMKGQVLASVSSKLPGLVEYRFNQLQEIEAILEYLNIQYKKTKTAKFRKYLEHYNKALTSRDAEKYAEGDKEVVDLAVLTNEFALLRNQFLGITKGLEVKHWMIGNIVKLRCAGLDDAYID